MLNLRITEFKPRRKTVFIFLFREKAQIEIVHIAGPFQIHCPGCGIIAPCNIVAAFLRSIRSRNIYMNHSAARCQQQCRDFIQLFHRFSSFFEM